MATPTPSGASKRPAGNVSTPSHLIQSSPPRSVPSPATARSLAGKTPVSHATTGSTGSRTITSTPMIQSLSQAGNTGSPPGNMLNLGTPSGLGIMEGLTPAGLNVPTPALGATGMLPTMSELGLTASSVKRNEDEERRTKMRKVLKSIGKPKGRVSEEGIARIARRVGFQNDIDAEKLTADEAERRVGNRLVTTAGHGVVIETDMKNSVPRSVQVSFAAEGEALAEQGAKAGEVLLNDLKAAGDDAINAKLDGFAANLDYLARLDRLGSNGVSCFQALSGVYTSLCRLYEQERSLAAETSQESEHRPDHKANLNVIRKRSGKPSMHARRKLGLAITYWQDSVSPLEAVDVDDDELDQGAGTGQSSATGNEHQDSRVFALRIEAEPCSADLYPCLRVSDDWLPSPLELSSTSEYGVHGIPWQDPSPTFAGPGSSSDITASNGNSQLPGIRFIAKLDQPVIMPYTTAVNILNAVGATPPQILRLPPEYAALLLDRSATTVQHTHATHDIFTTTAAKEVLSVDDGQETIVWHAYNLENAKPALPTYAEYGYKLDKLPFSHPRQLIELLPTLRQWACVGELLMATFGNSTQRGSEEVNGHTNGNANGHIPLDELLHDADKTCRDSNVSVNMVLTTTPAPTIGVTFPLPTGGIANITVQIQPNAEIIVTNQEGLMPTDCEDNTENLQRLAKALEASGDLGVWIEWLRVRRR